ncbi:MAG: SLC13 family permease, partial [Anaerolineales bacterium]
MTPEIALTLFILGIAVILLVFERLRADLIALLVLLSLALTGLVSPEEAVSGFSNPAVITVWAMFILSAGLARTGVASLLGRLILRIGGKKESGLVLSLMGISAALSAFINNVGVVAMLLPVVNHISRKRKMSPSLLLMPLAVGVFLGGVNTLIGTPPNILASNSLNEFIGRDFRFFDFLLAGLPVTIAGIAFMVVFGRKLLPQRNLTGQLRHMGEEAGELFELEERLFSLRLPEDSLLAGKQLSESRLGAALKLNVISITRKGKTKLAPRPSTQLHGGDKLLVLGKGDWLKDLIQAQHLTLEGTNGQDQGRERLD